MSAYESTSSMKMLLKSGAQATADSGRRKQWMRVLHEAMKVVGGPCRIVS